MLALGGFPTGRARDKPPWRCVESRDDFCCGDTYRAAQVADHGSDARLLSQDYRGFYFSCHVTRESVYRHRTQYDRQLSAAHNLGPYLQAEGFTHLLLAESTVGDGIRFEPTLSQLVNTAQEAGAGESLLPLLAYEIVDSDGVRRRYRLLSLR